MFRKVLKTYKRDNKPVLFKQLRTDVCDFCVFLNAAIQTSTGAALKDLERIREDHLQRAQDGYDVVSEFHRLAKEINPDTKTPYYILIEYDFLKTDVYPHLTEEPTHKYRATHKSLYRFGVYDSISGNTSVFFWDSQEAKKVPLINY